MKSAIKVNAFDIIVIAFALVFTIGSALWVYIPGGFGTEFIIEAQGRVWTYPADSMETLFHIEGAIGISVVEIIGGSIRMVSSPCANQTCVAAGSINRTGQWIACLPNQVFIHAEGRGQNDDDTIDGATW